MVVTAPVASLQDQFLAILPRIEQHGRYCFRELETERREEAIAEMTAICWRSFVRLVQRGKNPLAWPTVLANYAVRHVRRRPPALRHAA